MSSIRVAITNRELDAIRGRNLNYTGVPDLGSFDMRDKYNPRLVQYVVVTKEFDTNVIGVNGATISGNSALSLHSVYLNDSLYDQSQVLFEDGPGNYIRFVLKTSPADPLDKAVNETIVFTITELPIVNRITEAGDERITEAEHGRALIITV